MKSINHLTAAECNAKIRELQKEMCTALNSDERDSIRSQIARLAQHAAFLNRNIVRVSND
jgi:hypothetical protein